ncbi:hypothetical protein DL767_008431 [Monosporascus sp. MG133]|nr:hypothetical protein DL767_008431 [Monosporascus sp. MG133]
MADRSKKRQCDQEVPDLIEEDRPRKRQPTRTQPVSSYDLGDSRSRLAAQSSFVGQGIQHLGTGPFQVHGNLNIGALHPEKPTQCLADLYSTDPRHDKNRIEETKGGLLRDSYRWILDHHDFIRWRDDSESRLLWIKGDPGKGKTMLLCGIIDELMNQNARTEQAANTTHLLSFFFCQATDDRLNNATAVLRGLIYLLVDQQPFLVSHIQKKYNHAGKTLFEGVNAWFALREILINILQDPGLPNVTLIIDALDECETDLSQLLDLIIKVSSRSSIKWLLSSRNRIDIEQKLRPDYSRTRLSLELKSNADHVLHAVNAYIDHCISETPAIQNSIQLQTQIRDQMRRKADGTFLWVGLVAQELKAIHYDIFSRSLDVLSKTLRRDIYRLDDPGLPVDEVTSPDPDPLAAARYSCIHWVDHLAECKPDEQAQYENFQDGGMIDRFLRQHYLHWLEALSIFENMSEGILAISKLNGLLQPAVEHNWNACLSTLEGHGDLVNSVAFSPDGSWLASGSRDCTIKVWDAATGACLSTLKGHGKLVASVAFSPDGSRLASGSRDRTVKVWDAATGACLSTFKGHGDLVASVAFSPDGSRLASGSWDDTVKVWDAATGACLSTFDGHGSLVTSVAFSPDGSRVASGSGDRTVKVWDAATGACLSTFEGYGGLVASVAFSPDGNYLITDTGTIPLPASLKNHLLLTVLQQSPNEYFNLGVKNEWITYNDQNLLWLPPDYRPGCSAVTARAIAVGCRSGRIWMSTFSLN